MFIIAGLGNPGKEYEHTRHNAGFMAVDYLAYKNNISLNKTKFKGICGDGIIAGNKVVLLKPQTYMNLSGQSILDAVQFYKVDLENLIIIYDDVSIPVGRIRLRPSGSDGGHNGMKSIIYLLGQDSFPRVRVGIGGPKYDMVDHVIGKFDEEEKDVIIDVLKTAGDAVESIITDGIQTAMNQYNRYRHKCLTEKTE